MTKSRQILRDLIVELTGHEPDAYCDMAVEHAFLEYEKELKSYPIQKVEVKADDVSVQIDGKVFKVKNGDTITLYPNNKPPTEGENDKCQDCGLKLNTVNRYGRGIVGIENHDHRLCKPRTDGGTVRTVNGREEYVAPEVKKLSDIK